MTLGQNVSVNVNSVKDLGVTVNDHLKFDVHINNTFENLKARAHRLFNLRACISALCQKTPRH